jgi:hypothetical protein
MQALANTAATILRGTTTDAYGDVDDAATVAHADVPAAIVESSKVVTDPSSQTPRTIRAITCVMPGWADVLNTDRVQDQGTGYVYAIESVEAQPSLGYPADTVLTLRRLTAAGK